LGFRRSLEQEAAVTGLLLCHRFEGRTPPDRSNAWVGCGSDDSQLVHAEDEGKRNEAPCEPELNHRHQRGDYGHHNDDL
jgi:hypothetical protein